MSTEYRRGIPSTAHVEAATRLGLLWHREAHRPDTKTKFAIVRDLVRSNYGSSIDLESHTSPVISNENSHSYRPIRPDGTPLDWEVLDQEVARVGQPQTMAPPQPQGFRADLWRRMCQNFLDRDECELSLSMVEEFDGNEFFRFSNGNCLSITQDSRPGYTRTDILARWTVYQELKPLYDLVDGGEGEAAMPRDVEAEWDRRAGAADVRTDGDWSLHRNVNGFFAQSSDGTTWFGGDYRHAVPLRNFAAVLDAVAERRVAERMRGQAPTVTPVQSAQPEPRRFADVRPDRHVWRWWRVCNDSLAGSRFDSLNGDWRWLSSPGFDPTGHLADYSPWVRANLELWASRTVIPTDEQGNPVSWGAAGFAAEDTRTAQERAQPATNDTTPSRSVGDIEWTVTGQTGTLRDVHTARIRQLDRFVAEAIQAGNTGGFSIESPTPRPGQFSNNPATPPLTPEGFRRAANLFLDTLNREAEQHGVPGIHAAVGTGAKPAQTEVITTLSLPLPRFTADELDDVDHSKTTKLDEVMLRRGKLPTVEQIAKYREVRAKRTGGTVADALKESRIDCEVAQYVLERWAGGLGDADTVLLLRAAGCIVPLQDASQHSIRAFDPKQGEVDRRAQDFLRTHNATLDTAEKPSPTVQRERQEAEERRQRLAELRQRLAAERAAQPQEMAKDGDAVSRFDLIEPDPQADPTASIRAWEARQAAAKVHPTTAPPRIAKPAAAPRRPAIEVVDAEVDGLSRSEAFVALFGRALNGGC